MQQINLYLPELRPRREWLTFNFLALVVTGLVAFYGLLYLLGQHNHKSFAAQVAMLENRRQAAEHELQVVQAKAQPLQGNQLDQQLVYLRAALRSRQQVGEIIEGQNLGNSEGFVQAMTALAELSIETISVERIALTGGGDYLQLSGKTRKPEDVATYIAALQADERLLLTRFGLLSVAQLPQQRDLHSFSLGFDSVYQVAGERR